MSTKFKGRRYRLGLLAGVASVALGLLGALPAQAAVGGDWVGKGG